MTVNSEGFHPAVDALPLGLDAIRAALLRQCRALLLSVDARVREDVKWNSPSYFLPQGCFATLNVRVKQGVMGVLHFDARGTRAQRPDIPDPQGLLEWKSADRAVWVVTDADALARHAEAIRAVLRAWIAAWVD